MDSQIDPTFAFAFDILGKRWTGLILATLDSGPRSFSDILDLIPDLNDSMLSKRLKELRAEGIVERRVYTETPVRITYALTEKGKALHSVLTQVQEWADVWVQ